MYTINPLLWWSMFCVFKKTISGWSLRWRLSVMLSAGDKWITRPWWGRVLSRRRRLMDGESGLYDTSPAEDPEFRASAVAKRKAGMQTPPLGGECQSQTLAHDECEPWRRGEVKLHLPPSCALLSSSQQYTHLLSLRSYRDYSEEYSSECYCPNVWTANGNTKELSPPFIFSSASKYPLTLWTLGCSCFHSLSDYMSKLGLLYIVLLGMS